VRKSVFLALFVLTACALALSCLSLSYLGLNNLSYHGVWEYLGGVDRPQNWPSRTIRIVVPFPPGGTTDQIARAVQPLLQKDLNVPVVIENRGGASGSIGTQTVVASPADGYTFLLVFDTHAVNPSLIPNIPYDTVKDLAPVMVIARSPMVITAHRAAAYKSFADIVSASKEKPESVSFGTIASGSLAHLAMTQIANQLGVAMNHVPYKGGGPLTVDAIAGHIPVAIASVALLYPYIKTGQLVPLAVTSPERAAQLPDTPTVAELALPGYHAEAWWGMLAPARTPPDIIERLRASMTAALNEASIKNVFEEQGLIYDLSSGETFGGLIESEIARWGKVVRDNHVTIGH
jgi:tripartite-type tricarboxylate transporter receptor subunit TctC